MTFVVTESCICCNCTDCVDVCPVEALRDGSNFPLIDFNDCIDCAVCMPEYPVNAIYADADERAKVEHKLDAPKRRSDGSCASAARAYG